MNVSDLYSRDISRFNLLTAEREKNLGDEIQRGDRAARRELIESYF